MALYNVTVRYTGKLEYQINAESEDEALLKAEDLCSEEDRLGDLSDIEWEATSAILLNSGNEDGIMAHDEPRFTTYDYLEDAIVNGNDD